MVGWYPIILAAFADKDWSKCRPSWLNCPVNQWKHRMLPSPFSLMEITPDATPGHETCLHLPWEKDIADLPIHYRHCPQYIDNCVRHDFASGQEHYRRCPRASSQSVPECWHQHSVVNVNIILIFGQLGTSSGQVTFLGYLSDGQVVFKFCSKH